MLPLISAFFKIIGEAENAFRLSVVMIVFPVECSNFPVITKLLVEASIVISPVFCELVKDASPSILPPAENVIGTDAVELSVNIFIFTGLSIKLTEPPDFSITISGYWYEESVDGEKVWAWFPFNVILL